MGGIHPTVLSLMVAALCAAVWAVICICSQLARIAEALERGAGARASRRRLYLHELMRGIRTVNQVHRVGDGV